MPGMEPIDRLEAALAGRYRVEKELGRGGMATVYLAHDLRHGRAVALKVLHADLASAVGADRFLREVRTTAGLRHPNILTLYDSGEVDGLLYYTMPLAEGESLRERLARERQLPVDEAVRITREVAQALDHAHLAYQRLGQIAEAEGRVEDALRYYGLLIDLWRDCDEDLVPLREETRERRDVLASVAASGA